MRPQYFLGFEVFDFRMDVLQELWVEDSLNRSKSVGNLLFLLFDRENWSLFLGCVVLEDLNSLGILRLLRAFLPFVRMRELEQRRSAGGRESSEVGVRFFLFFFPEHLNRRSQL